MLSSHGMSGHPSLVSQLFTIEYNVCCGFVLSGLIMLKYISFILTVEGSSH